LRDARHFPDFHVSNRKAESHVANALPSIDSVDQRFQQKTGNFEAAVALNFEYYNFCKLHGAIRCTPAMAAGVENSQWTVAELVERCGE
jgi:hypothetical protein